MQNRVVSFFSSYDIFGKSFPGAVFFAGSISVFPLSLLPHIEGLDAPNIQLTNLIVAIFVALSVGLVFGEAVHTLADNSEKLVAWLARRAISGGNFLKQVLPGTYAYFTASLDYSNSSQSQIKIRNIIEDIIAWCKRRFYGIQYAFKSHRRLFAESCITNYGNKYGPRKDDGAKPIFQEFESRFDDAFETSLPKTDVDELMGLYPLITSQIERGGGTQYRRFQSIYSFCRSMWVTLLFFGLVHFSIYLSNTYFPETPLAYRSVGVELLSGSTNLTIPVFLLIGAILFMDAAGTYKQHYVEYLIAEFSIYSEYGNDDEDTKRKDTFLER